MDIMNKAKSKKSCPGIHTRLSKNPRPQRFLCWSCLHHPVHGREKRRSSQAEWPSLDLSEIRAPKRSESWMQKTRQKGSGMKMRRGGWRVQRV